MRTQGANTARHRIELDIVNLGTIRATLVAQGFAVEDVSTPELPYAARLTGTASGLASWCFKHGYDELKLVRGGVGYAR